MSDFDLSAFLASRKAEGLSLDEGEFTISHQKGAQKTAQYALPREHAWVLKIVQAAVAWKCRKIHLTQTRTHSTFTFFSDVPEAFPTNRELIEAVLRPDFQSPEPLANFASALRVLVEQSALSFLLLLAGSEDDPQSIYAGLHYAEMGERQRNRQRQAWQGSLNLKIHHIPHTDSNRLLLNYIPVRHHALPMALELERYAYTSPIPILLDGRRVDGVLRSSILKWSPRVKAVHLGPLDVSDQGIPPLAICEGFAEQTLSVHATLTDQHKYATPERDYPIYWLLRLRAPSGRKAGDMSISWIRHGVIIEATRLRFSTWSLGLRVYLSADGIRSDLSGFGVVQNDEFQRRQEVLQTAVLEALYLADSLVGAIFAPSATPDQSGDVDRLGENEIASLRRFAKRLTIGVRAAGEKLRFDAYSWDDAANRKLYRSDLKSVRNRWARC